MVPKALNGFNAVCEAWSAERTVKVAFLLSVVFDSTQFLSLVV